jgi:hypothetical protein
MIKCHVAGLSALTFLRIGLDHRALMQGAAVKSKSQQIREALAVGDQVDALRIAARFFDRSSATKNFQTGHGCLQSS